MKSPAVRNLPGLPVPAPVPREQVCVTLVPGAVVPELPWKATEPKGRGRAGKLRQWHSLKETVEDWRLPTECAARV